MKIQSLHRWDVTPSDAAKIQERLSSKVVLRDLPGPIHRVAGIDAAYSKGSSTLWAGVVILGYPSFDLVEHRWIEDRVEFPYIPGLLSFRELPPVLKLLARIEKEPDLIFADAHGIAHPRGFGLASHLGLLCGKATIGCAKKRLVGEHIEVGGSKGDYVFLFYRGRKVGAVVRTRNGTKPLFISPGYGITVPGAIDWILRCGGRYRIPEPLRQAHILVNRLRRLGGEQ